MIEHTKIYYGPGVVTFSDKAQHEAEYINRQEVTSEWYLTNGLDNNMQLWVWLDRQSDYGLDPWLMIDGPEDKPNARYFVQRNQMP